MVLLGLILILLAAGAGVLLFAGTAQITDTVDVSILGGTLSLPPLTLLVTGMVVISVFWLGWVLMRGGLRRGKRKRVEAKEAAATAEARRVEEERRVKEEFATRERELAEERRRREEETTALRQQVQAQGGGTTGATDTTGSRTDGPPPVAPSGSTPPPPPPTGH
ncbi:hypothetical protein [Oryzobacter telluris]|uniref:hypothetical protein n=1 Tax=Oryzobacter telluris TaxID=3149179 RepID=UPI00370DA021